MPRVNVPGVGVVNFPDTMSEEQIAAAIQTITPQAAHEPNAAPPAAPMVNVGGRGTGLDVRTSQRRMTAALPTLGSMGGAALGGLTSPVTGPVGPVAGAALGGGLGESLRQAAAGEAQNPAASMTRGMAEGSLQAMSPALGVVAKGLYKGGVALLPKGLKQAAPKLAETGYREGIALTRRGASKADALIRASSQKADDMIAAAQAGGAAPIRPMEVLRELKPVGQKIRTQADLGMADDMPALMTRAKGFMRRGPIPLVKAQELKREAQDLATTAYKARDKGAVINNLEALTNEGQARGLRKGLENRVSGLGDVNARTKELIGLREGAEHASQTGHIIPRVVGATALGGMAGPAGIVPALVAGAGGAMLTTPGGLSATGLALKPVASHLPQAVRAALLLSLLAEEGEQ